MKRFLVIFGGIVFVTGGAMLTYDLLFIHHFGFDANEVLTSTATGVVDWETGRRPAYSYYPAWMWAIRFILVGFCLFVLPRRKRKATRQ